MNSLVYTSLVIIVDLFTCSYSFKDDPVPYHRSTYRSLFSLHWVSFVSLLDRTLCFRRTFLTFILTGLRDLVLFY